jgi:hypothetical protein
VVTAEALADRRCKHDDLRKAELEVSETLFKLNCPYRDWCFNLLHARHEVAARLVGFGSKHEQAIPILRDIFGNPFRPVTIDPIWRTSTAVAIANGMYESRDFGAMPILADALQEAGCDSDDILNHCRAAGGIHVRGCWVVDLVLDKS